MSSIINSPYWPLLRLVIVGGVTWLCFKVLAPMKLGWVVIPLGFVWAMVVSMYMHKKREEARREHARERAKAAREELRRVARPSEAAQKMPDSNEEKE